MRSSSAQHGAAGACAAAEPVKLRGRFLTAVVLPVCGVADDAFYAALDALLQQSPGFFADAPLVVDVHRADGLDAQEGFAELLRQLRLRRLSPIGIQNATETQSLEALKAGLTTVRGGRDTPLERRPPRDPAASAGSGPPQAAQPAPAAMLVTEPVRSGQRIVAEGDLVVVASVGSGAELVAHGNIHVYGRLRGRALAGVSGDRAARIFCQSLEAELIAIAGLYKTSDGLGAAVAKQRVQAFLRDDALCIEALK